MQRQDQFAWATKQERKTIARFQIRAIQEEQKQMFLGLRVIDYASYMFFPIALCGAFGIVTKDYLVGGVVFGLLYVTCLLLLVAVVMLLVKAIKVKHPVFTVFGAIGTFFGVLFHAGIIVVILVYYAHM